MSRIAVLSGKGGSGKTFVSTNLSNVIQNSTYLDCDVEEPNGLLFFNDSSLIEQSNVYREIPTFNKDKCIGCRDCVNFCKFSALAFIKDTPLLFEEVCHSCGGCELVCKHDAIELKKINVGSVSKFSKENNTIISGEMNVGEASAVPIISNVLNYANDNSIIDCPPGSACSTMEAIKGAEFCILVTEPTIFSLHNIKMIVELVTLFKIPFGFVINKSNEKLDYIIEDYVNSINKEILVKIPFTKDIAKITTNGMLVSDESEQMRQLFISLSSKLKEEVNK